MKQQEKLKAAFDSLLQDVNTRIEEVRENITNLTADFRTQVEGQKENLSEYQEKISSRLNELVNVDSTFFSPVFNESWMKSNTLRKMLRKQLRM